jgi:hypothetical protein
MADISEIQEHDRITFSSSTARADEWMILNYALTELIFGLPSEADKALEFKNHAEREQLTIEDL